MLVALALAGGAPGLHAVSVPVPRSGSVELAVVRFERAGATLTPAGMPGLPKTAAVVTGVSGRVGVVAIANFHARRSTAAALVASRLRVATSVPFRVDYLGPVANGCGASGICPARALAEVEQAGRWTTGPGTLPPADVEPSYRTETGLLTQVVDALVGVPSARFALALAGGPKPPQPAGKGPAGPQPATGAPGLSATASLVSGADGSVTLHVQNTGVVAITSVSLQGIDFTPTALAPPTGVSCRLTSPGMVCDAGFSIAPGQSLQFTVASYTCCLIGGDVWVNDTTGTTGQYGPVTALVG
jgi:hypothetical protein